FAGKAADPALTEFSRAANSGYFPNKIVLFHKEGPEGRVLETLAPFVKEQTALNGRMTAYVCRDRACGLPVTAPEGVRERLGFAHAK
ncbi:MAG TPA: thioredoxin domain-containing protein, partial [Candidatus Eisenbacteria bacterium]|nr:thioredoxin domain-containing protein [Candidatus Eisenbacteria bacterium]